MQPTRLTFCTRRTIQTHAQAKTPSRVAGHRRTGPMPDSRFQTDSAHDSLKRRSDEPCPRGLHHAHARVKPTARVQLRGCRREPARVPAGAGAARRPGAAADEAAWGAAAQATLQIAPAQCCCCRCPAAGSIPHSRDDCTCTDSAGHCLHLQVPQLS